MSRNNYFQFKQFRIVQERSAMKVGMDGVLLGAWADVSTARRILDVGTGTGLVALMMAQKKSNVQVDAIEIDAEAYREAAFNVQQSAWANRIQVQSISFQDFLETTSGNYDLIVSNPPFFTNGVKAPDENRSQARHADALPLDILIKGAAGLLREKGRMVLVLPIETFQEIEKLAASNGLFVSKLCRVKPNPVKPDFRLLVEMTNKPSSLQEENLMIEFEKHHNYTPEYKSLTKDFYLKF